MNIVKSMAYIKYKNNNILQGVCNHIEKLGSNFYPQHVINILISLAILGYEGEHVNNLIKVCDIKVFKIIVSIYMLFVSINLI